MIHKADKELKQRWIGIFRQLPTEAQVALKNALRELSIDARKKAEYSWKKHKAPMALYWKTIAVYSGHLQRAL